MTESLPREARPELAASDAFGILSATWILASNDENPIMTYAAIYHRLRLPAEYPLRALIQARGDLFRLGVPEARLAAWKAKMIGGKAWPSWLHNLTDEERKAKIEALSRSDCFRSQFRTGDGEARSELAIIKWGLEHIERLRQAASEVSEARTRRWSALWIPLTSTALAALAIVGGALQTSQSRRADFELKRYELSFAVRQASYAKFMQGLIQAGEATEGDEAGRMNARRDIEAAMYSMEPFLADTITAAVRAQVDTYFATLMPAADSVATNVRGDEVRARLERLREVVRERLFHALFRDAALPDGRL
jgi:hypothetical protein